MAIDRDYPFTFQKSRQGFASPSRRPYASELGKKGQEARQRRMAERRAAGEEKVWSGGFKKGDPYTKTMAKFAINERWRKYYERKAREVEATIEYDPEKYEQSLRKAEEEIQQGVVPAKNEAKYLSQYLQKTKREVGRVGGIVERIQRRIEDIRRAAAEAPPRKMYVLPTPRPPMPEIPGEKPASRRVPIVTEKEYREALGPTVEMAQESIGISIPIRGAPAPEEPKEEIVLTSSAEVLPSAQPSEASDPAVRLGFKTKKLSNEELEVALEDPKWLEKSPQERRSLLSREIPRRRALKEAAKQAAEAPSTPEAPPAPKAAPKGAGPIAAVEPVSLKTPSLRESFASLYKPKGKSKAEIAATVTAEHMAAAAMLIAMMGRSVAAVAGLARKIASRAEEYEMGVRDPMYLDPHIAASPSVQRALADARRRLRLRG